MQARTKSEGKTVEIILELFAPLKRLCTVKKDHRQLSLVETLSLGGKKQLILVECSGVRYLVGCADGVQAIVPASVQMSEKVRPSIEFISKDVEGEVASRCEKKTRESIVAAAIEKGFA